MKSKRVLFFDIDNCLYSNSIGVSDMMVQYIEKYFATHLSLSPEDANRLCREYSTNYGLAIQGLVRHHQIDTLEFNAEVDDALPLEDVIKPDPELRSLLEDIDRDSVILWLFTNAYVTHAQRVVRLLGVDDLFDGLTFCDYSSQGFVCKPSEVMFQKAMLEAGVDSTSQCFFVDDSYHNCAKAQELGWTAAHLVEDGVFSEKPTSYYQIRSLQELRNIFPELFKSNRTTTAPREAC